jgi:uncharacterized protein
VIIKVEKRYNDFNGALRAEFGCRVQKISLDAGLSCPNRDGTLSTGGCIYCNARGSGTGAAQAGLSIQEQIQNAKAFLSKRYKAKKFIGYFQSYTNTHAPLATLKALYDQATADPDIVGIAIGTRPDCVGNPVLDLIEGYAKSHSVWIEYGLQSIHDKTLHRINRGHTLSCFIDAVQRTRHRGIRICAHLIIGLPGECPEDMLKSAEVVAGLGIDAVKLHLLYVVKGTPLEKLYRDVAYQCLDQEVYTDIVCDIIERLPSSMVIQRLTGDPHPQELVAPLWALRKKETLDMIQQRLIGRDSWQGKRLDCPLKNPFL